MLDEWLSEILGYPVYNSLTPPESDKRSLTYAKVPVDDVGTVHELTELGFRVVDVNITLEHLWNWSGLPIFHGVSVLDVEDSETVKRVVEIASSCFSYSRFHLDPKIPNELANKVKSEWVRSYAEGTRGHELLVAWDEGKPSGFLAVLFDGDVRVIDLIGVAKPRQRIGSRLVNEFKERYAPRNLRAGTQISNIPSLGLYRRCGFGVSSASYVLHLHRGIQ